MQYRPLGSTGLKVSAISFGAGPVSQLLVSEQPDAQRETIAGALDLGINWFDTAATYGDGQSEASLGRVLSELPAGRRAHVATKVRIMPDQLSAIGTTVRESIAGSLRRLRRERLTLVQIHNSITAVAGAQPTSLTPAHVLAPGGLLAELEKLKRDGVIEHLGLTGLGEPQSLWEVIDSGAFETLQIPYNLLNASAGHNQPSDDGEANYGNLITRCGERGMGVFAIRVLAGGALAAQPPSPHTLKTPFFPLNLYERDRRRTERLEAALPDGLTREEVAVRFALRHPAVTSAIIGFATPQQVAAAVAYADTGPLDPEVVATLRSAVAAGEEST